MVKTHGSAWFTGIRRMNRCIVSVLLVALLPLATGCYGRFPLTKAVYRLNGKVSISSSKVDDSVVRSVVFWAFVIIPVYGVAMICDAVVLNLIQFWTGETMEISTGTNPDGSTYALVPTEDGNEATLTISRDGETVAQTRFVRTSPEMFAVLNEQGHTVGQVVQTSSGGFELTDINGNIVQSLSADAIAAL